MKPFGPLTFLYVGTTDTARDLRYYRDVLGGEEVWHVKEMGAEVAAVRLGEGPVILLADHRPAPSVMPIYRVDDIEATAAALRKRGWKPDSGPFEIPNGPCYTWKDPTGNAYAFFQDVRPQVMSFIVAEKGVPEKGGARTAAIRRGKR